MTKWWTNEVFGNLNINRDSAGSFPLDFGLLLRLEKLELTFGPNSTGVLPGSLYNDADPCATARELPESLRSLTFNGQRSDPPLNVRTGTGPGYNFFKSLVRTSGCSNRFQLTTLNVVRLPGLREDFGRSRIGGCVDIDAFTVVACPLVTAIEFCSDVPVDFIGVERIGSVSVYPDLCTPFTPIFMPSILYIISSGLRSLPTCFVTTMARADNNGGTVFVLIRDNGLCAFVNAVDRPIVQNETVIGDGAILTPRVINSTLTISRGFVKRDNRDCIGCNGVTTYPPAEPLKNDVCNVCNGTGLSCLDCARVPFGTSVRDACGICNGLETACSGCSLRINDRSRYNLCGDCGPDPPLVPDLCAACQEFEKDACGVCFGNGASCRDCQGIVFGSSRRDRCNVCNGDGRSCLDCADEVFGTNVVDACGICGGDGTACIGCDGVLNSGKVVDACGVCGGNNACIACDGVRNGLSVTDECGVCDGDGTSCIDCAGQVNGPLRVGRCGNCYDPRNSTAACDPALIDELVSDRSVIWAVYVVLMAIGAFCVALVIFASCSRCINWAWLGTAKLTRRRTRSNSLGSTDTRAVQAQVGAAYHRGGGGAGAGHTALLFAAVLMISGASAQSLAPPQIVYRELCDNTDLSLRAATFCLATGSASVCDTSSGFGAPFFVCEQTVAAGVRIVQVNLHLLPFRGTITRRAFRAFRTARIVRITGADNSVSQEERFSALRIEAFGSDDTLFEGFSQLESFRMSKIGASTSAPLLPLSLSEAQKLRVLELNEVDIGGDFGRGGVLCSLPRLEVLRVRSARLTGPAVCPHYQIGWRSLRELDVRDNSLTGTLPNLLQLTSLLTLTVSNNALSGLHPDVANLPSSLTELVTSYNQFSGTISGDWRRLTNLTVFLASDNQLTGSVPLFRTENLFEFDISYNGFTGTLPASFGSVQRVGYRKFRVNDNRLSEPWPPFASTIFLRDCKFERQSICRSLNPAPVPTPTVAFPPTPAIVPSPIPSDFLQPTAPFILQTAPVYSSARVRLGLVDCSWDCSADSGSKNRLLFSVLFQCGTTPSECPRAFPDRIVVNAVRGVRADSSSVLLDFDAQLRPSSFDTRTLQFSYSGSGTGAKTFTVTGGNSLAITSSTPRILLLAVSLATAPEPGLQFYDVDVTAIDENWLCDAPSASAGICPAFDVGLKAIGRIPLRLDAIPTAGCSAPCPTRVPQLPPKLTVTRQAECVRDCRYASDRAVIKLRTCFAHTAPAGTNAVPVRMEVASVIVTDAARHVSASPRLLNERTGATATPYASFSDTPNEVYFFGINPALVIGPGEHSCITIEFQAQNAGVTSAPVAVNGGYAGSHSCSIIELQSGACAESRLNSSAVLSLAVDLNFPGFSAVDIPQWENGGRRATLAPSTFSINPSQCAYNCDPSDVYSTLDNAGCSYSLEDVSACAGGCGDRSCLGCDGVPNSGKVRDVCGVCGGNGAACRDCAGVSAGTARIDACGVCGGNNSTCLDCRGVVLGRFVRDVCGVCNGDASTCADCFGVPRGTAVLDQCGVCGGDGNSCRDCAGVVNGTSLYDEDAVCNGDGSLNSPVDDDDDALATDIIRVRGTQPVWLLLLQLFLLALVLTCVAFACVSTWSYRMRTI